MLFVQVGAVKPIVRMIAVPGKKVVQTVLLVTCVRNAIAMLVVTLIVYAIASALSHKTFRMKQIKVLPSAVRDRELRTQQIPVGYKHEPTTLKLTKH